MIVVPPAETKDGSQGTSWREQAVARRLDPARARAENRVQRFLDAANALMEEANSTDFTVQEVVQRSGQSLRNFYQYFNSKQEFLLALFEESVGQAATQLGDLLAGKEGALELLHTFVIEYYRICRPTHTGIGAESANRVNPAMVEFAQQLLTSHPVQAAQAFAPIVTLFEEILDRAAEEGVVRSDLNRPRAAGVILEAIMFSSFSRTIGNAPSAADDATPAEGLLDLVLHGVINRG
jgi:AcrR family transcriptional regulator